MVAMCENKAQPCWWQRFLSPPFLLSIILTLFLSFLFVFFQFHYPLHGHHLFYLYFIMVAILFFFAVKRKQNGFQPMESWDKILIEVLMAMNPSPGRTATLRCGTAKTGIVSAFFPACTALDKSQTLHMW